MPKRLQGRSPISPPDQDFVAARWRRRDDHSKSPRPKSIVFDPYICWWASNFLWSLPCYRNPNCRDRWSRFCIYYWRDLETLRSNVFKRNSKSLQKMLVCLSMRRIESWHDFVFRWHFHHTKFLFIPISLHTNAEGKISTTKKNSSIFEESPNLLQFTERWSIAQFSTTGPCPSVLIKNHFTFSKGLEINITTPSPIIYFVSNKQSPWYVPLLPSVFDKTMLPRLWMKYYFPWMVVET